MIHDNSIFRQCKDSENCEFLANVSRKTEKRTKKLSLRISQRAVTEIPYQWNYKILGKMLG